MKAGDKVALTLDDEKVEGQFLPAPQGRDDIIILKLSSGYNLVVKKDRIKHAQIIEPARQKKKQPVHIEQNSSLKKVTLLHTGGTIAARVDYKLGAVLSGFITGDELLSIYPELRSLANVTTRMVCNIASEDMRFSHYNLIIDAIKEEVASGADAIIIPHGTDTLHYTSAALAFALDGLQIPIILVGSQRSSDRGSSDAYLNLISAVYFAINSDFCGIAICMHDSPSDELSSILPAFHSRKMHTSRRDAFRPINAIPYALVDFSSKKIQKVSNFPDKTNRQLFARHFDDGVKVGIVKAHPNMLSKEISFYKNFDGLVIEGTGLGHFPNAKTDALTSENARIFREVGALVDSGVIVVMAPQTIYGRIQLSVYTPLRKIRGLGVLGHLCDMTPETAFIKLSFLLSNYTKDEARKLYEQNIAGEISSRNEEKDFLS